ncbi:MAG: hypothetical protein ACOYOB_02625 [Myxococcota bacterium]
MTTPQRGALSDAATGALGASTVRRKRLGVTFVMLAIGAFPALVHAQTAEMQLPNSVNMDRGLRSGDFTLHPSITVQGHHDTNFFNGSAEEAAAGNPIRGATSIRIQPRLSLANEANSDVSFTFNSAGEARIYVTEDTAISEQDDVGGTASVDVAFGARRALAFSVFDYFTRALRANDWGTTYNLNRTSNDVGARIEFHPGDIPERRPFNIALMGSYALDRFDDFGDGDTDTFRSRFSASWRFLPKTAAIIDAGWDFRNYANTSLLLKDALASNSKPFRARAGVAGALTRRISLEALGGWGMSMHKSGDTFNSFLASASLGLRASESTRLLLNYTHDFRDAYYGNFVDFHRGSLALRQRFGQIVDLKASFGVTYGVYGAYVPKIAVLITQKNRKDIAMDGGLSATFDVTRLVGMDIGYQLRSVATDYKVTALDAKRRLIDSGAFLAHELYAGITLRY